MAESKRIYRIASMDLGEINRVLAQIQDRLDELEGFRGEPTIRNDFKVVAEDDSDTIIHSLRGT
jgi:uncharacterized radical SAM superfamily Fe-S cluster-containing enzyme